MVYYVLITIAFLPLTIFFPTIVRGRKNLKKGKAIFTANHRSNMDPIMVYLKANRKMHFVAKKELFKNKFLAWLLNGLGCIKIDRQGTDINATKQVLKTLKDNKTVGIFPQGTRSQSEDMEIKSGVCMFAIKSKAPIVPIYIKRKPMFLVPNVIYVGEPFELDKFYDQRLTKEVLDEATAIVEQKYDELKQKYTKKKKEEK